MVVLVHGAWHGAWCWASLQRELDRRGIPSLAVDLPGHGASVEPLADLATDAAAVSAVLGKFRRPIVLVGHSYGGAVISEADLTGDDAGAGSTVFHLVYLAAFVVDVGESVIGLSGSMPEAPSALSGAMVIADGMSTIDPELAHGALYNRCDPMITPANVARLCPQPLATFTQPATRASWRHVPSTYVRCLDDQAVAPAHQDFMAARCAAIETLDTDHSPFVSMPVETAEIIARIVRR
jgi:pimeloyl-ACP methyl ester carboxylesterase